MTSKPFGWTGVEVPVIGQGTWLIEGNREKERSSIQALRAGLELGMTHIDTAEMYGNGRAEEVVAEAIQGCRERVFLVSKVLPSNASYEGTLRACERSLRRLRTDYLDLYLLHWPGSVPVAETMRAFETLVDRGLIRYLGVSNFDVAELQEAERALRHHRMACNQVLYHLGDRGIERRLIPYCRKRQIAVVGYSPFGHTRFPSAASAGGKLLAEIGKSHGVSARAVVLNFLTRHRNVFTIPKASNPQHTRENAAVAGWPLSEEEVRAIDKAFPAPTRDTPLGMI